MTQITIVHGPKGCGKTRNDKRLAAKYGCDFVSDAEDVTPAALEQFGAKHALLLTYDLDGAKQRFPGARTFIPFASAMA